MWSEVIAVPGDLSLRHLQMLRQGPPSCRHPLKYTAPCSYLCPGSIVAFDPLSEEKADHCRAAAHARPGSSGVPSTRGWKWGPRPRKAASSSGEWPGTQTGARCSQHPGTLFWQQREAVKPRAIGIKEKLPSSQSRCLGLSLVRGFMALHLYPPRTAAKCAVKGVPAPPRSEGSNPSARGSARGRKPLLKVCLQAANTASWCPLRVLPESVRTPGPVGWRPRPRSGPAHSLVA